jgi:hypothetical protein
MEDVTEAFGEPVQEPVGVKGGDIRATACGDDLLHKSKPD